MTALVALLLLGSVPDVGELAAGKFGLGGLRHGHGTSPKPGWELDDDGKPWVPVEQLARDAILAEIALLEGRRPGIGGPITLFILGLLTAVTGVGFLIGGAVDTAITMVLSWALYVGGGALAVGVVLMIVGLVQFVGAVNTQRRYDWRLDRLEERLKALDKLTGGPLPAITVAYF